MISATNWFEEQITKTGEKIIGGFYRKSKRGRWSIYDRQSGKWHGNYKSRKAASNHWWFNNMF